MFYDKLALPVKIVLLFFSCVVDYGDSGYHYRQNISLYKDEQWLAPTNESSRYSFIEYEKSHAQWSDTGNYTCVMRTKNKELRETIEIKVKAGTVLAAPQRSAHVRKNNPVTLFCDVRGDLPSNLTWEISTPNTGMETVTSLSNTTTVEQGHVIMTLDLGNIMRNMSGVYKCVAEACPHRLDDTINVTVVDVPSVALLRVVAVGASRVCLKWSVDEGNDHVKMCSVKHKANDTQSQYNEAAFNQTASDSPNQSVIVENLEKATSYKFEVMCTNSFGHSILEYSKWVTTFDADPDFVPHLAIEEVYSNAIGVRASAPPFEPQNYVDYYEILVTRGNGTVERHQCRDYKSTYDLKNLESAAIYKLQVTACNACTEECGELSDEKEVITMEQENRAESGTILWSSLLATAVLLVIVLGVWLGLQKYRERAARREFMEASLQRFNRGDVHSLDPELNIADQAELLPYNEKWEFPRGSLKLDKILGSGEFGLVRKAEARSICRPGRFTVVAVKLVSATARLHCMTALSRELKILANLGKHLNIVNLLGACTKNIPWGELLVIMEFCRFGNLRDYLLSHRADFVDQLNTCADKIAGAPSSSSTDYVNMNDNGVRRASCYDDSLTEDCRLCQDITDTKVEVNDSAPTTDYIQPELPSKYQGDYVNVNLEPTCTQDLLCWAWQVTQGMNYLGSRKILHGNLAARNILLADHNVVKICDFGMARSVYMNDYYKKQGNEPVPVKWMAIESLRDRIFSVQSDIWSFGVVLWEFFTLAQTPYPGVDSEKLCQKLVDGFRMTQPKYATTNVYQMMLNCWDAEPSKRPSFKELADSIAELLDEEVKKHYIDLNSQVIASNVEDAEVGVRDYLMMTPAKLKESITIER